jgi:acetate kinase
MHRLVREAGAMIAVLGGLDALVFTGGVGENSAEIRARTMDGLGFLGVKDDPVRNESGAGDREIGAPDAPARALVVSAREDIEIARQTRALLAASQRAH